MENVKITVVVEDGYGVLFNADVVVPRVEIVSPESAGGLKTVAEALLKAVR